MNAIEKNCFFRFDFYDQQVYFICSWHRYVAFMITSVVKLFWEPIEMRLDEIVNLCSPGVIISDPKL